MEGEVLIINDEVKNTASSIFNEILKKELINNKKTLIIAISGESGSGKSVISHELSALFRKNNLVCKCLCADNFYRIHPKIRRDWREAHKQEIGINEYDWEMINRITRDFRNREVSSFQVIDLNTQEPEKLTTDFSKIDVIIFDGVFVISNNLTDCDMRIFLTAPEERKKLAQITRGKENANDPFRDYITNKENQDVKNLIEELNGKEILFFDGNINKLEWKNGKKIYNLI